MLAAETLSAPDGSEKPFAENGLFFLNLKSDKGALEGFWKNAIS